MLMALTNDNPYAATNGANGTATIDGDGNWTYTPDENFNGNRFIYGNYHRWR